MTAPLPPAVAEAVAATLELLGGAATETTIEVTRHGTLRIVARRGHVTAEAKPHDWTLRPKARPLPKAPAGKVDR